MNQKQTKKLSEFIGELIKSPCNNPPPVTLEPVAILPKVQKFIDDELPNEHLKFCALIYLYYYDCFPEDVATNARQACFKRRLDDYKEVNRQLFLVAMITNNQMSEMLSKELSLQFYSSFVQTIRQHLATIEGQVATANLATEAELTDFQIKGQIERFAGALFKDTTTKTQHFFAHASLISNVGHQYIYLLYCDFKAKEMFVFQTRERRKFEKEIAMEWAKAAATKGLKLRCLEDLQRNRMFVDYTEVFESFLIEQVVLKGENFLTGMRSLHYSMFEFMPPEDFDDQADEEAEMMAAIRANGGRLPPGHDGDSQDDFENAEMEEIPSDFDEPNPKRSAPANVTQKNAAGGAKEADLDNEDFDDVNFDDDYADIQDDF